MYKIKDLHPYQVSAIKRMVREPELALFLDLGLGKTTVSLHAIQKLIYEKKIKSCVVVAPLRVVYSVWRQEALLWEYTKNLTFTTLHGGNKNSNFHNDADIFLINYEGLVWFADKIRKNLRNLKFDSIIFDESSKMKDPKTRRFKNIKHLIKIFKRKYLLTATPVPNRLQDIWSQFYLLDQGKSLDTSFTRFQNQYFYPVSQYVWVPRKETSSLIQEIIGPKTIRLKNEDYINLPEISYNSIITELPDAMRAGYKELEKEFFLQIEDTNIEIFSQIAMVMKLRQYIQGALYHTDKSGNYTIIDNTKLKALEEVVEAHSGYSLLIPIQFRFEREILLSKFKGSKIIAGGTTLAEGQQYIDDWNNGKIKILFCHPMSMSHGINLQRGGHIIIWYGLTWSLEQYSQLIGRIHRQGQINNVTIHHIVMNDTVDLALMNAIKNKAKTQQELLDNLKNYAEKLDHG